MINLKYNHQISFIKTANVENIIIYSLFTSNYRLLNFNEKKT